MFGLRRLGRYGLLLNAGLVLSVWTAGAGALWFMLPQIAEDFMGDVALAGVLMALPCLVMVLSDLPIGDMVDKVGGRVILAAALALLFLLGLSLSLVETAFGLVLFLLLLGLLYQAVKIPMFAYVMDLSPSGKSSRFLGVEFSFLHLGFAVGPLLAGVAAFFFASKVFVSSMLFSAACLAALFLALRTLRVAPGRESIVEGLKETVFTDRVFLKELSEYRRLGGTGLAILALTFVFTFYDGVVWMIEPLYYKSFSDKILWGGLLMSAFVVPLILFEAPAGFLADRYGRRRTLALGLLSAGVFSVLFSLSGSLPTLFATAFLATTGLALAWPSLEGVLAARTSSGSRGGYVGVWSLSEDLGYVAGPLAGGLLAERVGMGNVFLFLGLLLAASTLAVFFIRD